MPATSQASHGTLEPQIQSKARLNPIAGIWNRRPTTLQSPIRQRVQIVCLAIVFENCVLFRSDCRSGPFPERGSVHDGSTLLYVDRGGFLQFHTALEWTGHLSQRETQASTGSTRRQGCHSASPRMGNHSTGLLPIMGETKDPAGRVFLNRTNVILKYNSNSSTWRITL